jgi:hypothetical protein
VFVALNPGALPAWERSPVELDAWIRRDEQYAILGANVVAELYSQSRARHPTARAWAIIRRADRRYRLAGQRASRADRRHTDRGGRPDRTSRPHQPQERERGGRCSLTSWPGYRLEPRVDVCCHGRRQLLRRGLAAVRLAYRARQHRRSDRRQWATVRVG